MRERLSYTEEKINAWNRVTDLIDYLDHVPTDTAEAKTYREFIDRMAKRYGFKKQLRAIGYDLPQPHSGRFNRKKFLQGRQPHTDMGTP